MINPANPEKIITNKGFGLNLIKTIKLTIVIIMYCKLKLRLVFILDKIKDKDVAASKAITIHLNPSNTFTNV